MVCMATGSGKGRNAKQGWGLTKGPHFHWDEPNSWYLVWLSSFISDFSLF